MAAISKTRTVLLLENYHQLRESEEIGLRDTLIDLQNALENAKLDDLERAVIRILYLEEPEPPVRKDGRGRPPGGTTIESVAQRVGHLMPPGYSIELTTRTIYEYVKIARDRAILEIDKELNDEESEQTAV